MSPGARERSVVVTAVCLAVAVALLVVVGSAAPVAATEHETAITGCTTLDAAGEYVLEGDLRSADTCVRITAADVHLDGRGHVVAGNDTQKAAGIFVDGADNVTVGNLTVRNWNATGSAGVALANATNVTVADLRAVGNDVGLSVTNASASTASNVTIREGRSWDLAVDGTTPDYALEEIHLENETVSGTGEAFRLRSTGLSADPPDGSRSIGIGLEAQNVTDGFVLNLTAGYEASAVEDVREETIAFHRYDSGTRTWSQLADTDVNTTARDVVANATEPGILAAFGDERTHTLTVSLEDGMGNTYTDETTVTVSADGSVVANETVTGGETTFDLSSDTYVVSAESAGFGSAVTTVTIDGGTESVVLADLATVSSCGRLSAPGAYRLTANLTAADTCVVIAANDVVLDGAGYSVAGDAPSGEVSGILVDTASNVTVRNLTVSGWESDIFSVSAGIQFVSVDGGSIERVEAADNGWYGIRVLDSSSIDVRDSTASGNDRGVHLGNTHQSTLANVTATDNFQGVYLEGSSQNALSTVTSTASGENAVTLDGASNNDLTNVDATDSYRGVDLVGADGNVLTAVTATGNDERGISLAQSGTNSLRYAHAADNGATGVALVESSDNSLEYANASGNGDHGVSITAGGFDNLLLDTTANENAAAGVSIEGANDNTLRETTAEGNDRGIEVLGASRIDVIGAETGDSAARDVVVDDDATAATDTAFESVALENETVASTGENYAYHSTASPAAPPDGYVAIGAFVNASVATGGWLALEVHYEAADVETVDETTIGLWAYDAGNNTWTELADSSVDTASRVVSGTFEAEGVLGVFAADSGSGSDSGSSTDSASPASFEVSSLAANETLLAVGESVRVTADVTNVGEETGTHTVEFRVDGVLEGTTTVDLTGGETESVSFEHTFAAAGTYDLTVDGEHAGTVTVESVDGTEGGTDGGDGTTDDDGTADSGDQEVTSGPSGTSIDSSSTGGSDGLDGFGPGAAVLALLAAIATLQGRGHSRQP